MKKTTLILMVLVPFLMGATVLPAAEEPEKQFLTDWFVSLAAIDSQSSMEDLDMDEFPLNEGKREIARYIMNRLGELYGSEIEAGKVRIDRSQYEYIYIFLPATEGLGEVPSLMVMSHLDTTPEAPGGAVTPMVHHDYQGQPIALPAGITLDPSQAPGRHLNNCIGHTIITSDGSTLLGADDKAGTTILLNALDKILKNDIAHGDLYFVFTQNEDIGRAADGLELSYLGGSTPDMVIDLDGDLPNTYGVSNFTASQREYTFRGNNVHPGDGKKGGYADALTAAATFMGRMDPATHPGVSEGEEGYVHCYTLSHPVDSVGNEITTDYIVRIRIRYFDRADGDRFRTMIDSAAAYTRAAYPRVVIDAAPEVLQYENVAYTMHPALERILPEAMAESGWPYTPEREAVRGGTNSAMMAANGLNGGPCIYSAQQSEHSCYEWVSVDDMAGMTRVLLAIVGKVAQMKQ